MVLGQFPDEHFPKGQFQEWTILPNDISLNRHFAKSHFFYLSKSLFTLSNTKVAEANELQQKNI